MNMICILIFNHQSSIIEIPCTELNSAIISQLLYTHFSSSVMITFASTGPNEAPILTPWICLYMFPLNMNVFMQMLS